MNTIGLTTTKTHDMLGDRASDPVVANFRTKLIDDLLLRADDGDAGGLDEHVAVCGRCIHVDVQEELNFDLVFLSLSSFLQ